MQWHKLSENSQAMEALYAKVPSLNNVELHSVYLYREGAKIQIVFDLPVFPDKPPIKWNESFNTAQIQITFYDVKNFNAVDWNTEINAEINIEKVDEQLNISIVDKEIDLVFSFLCKFFRIDKVSAYQNSFGI